MLVLLFLITLLIAIVWAYWQLERTKEARRLNATSALTEESGVNREL